MSWLSQLMPWEPSPTVVVTMAAAGCLYLLGCRRCAPSALRQLAFWFGFILIYGALQTHLDYYAEREFFMHRLQHLVLHHLGPFLIALARPGPQLLAALPAGLRRRVADPVLASRPVRAICDMLMNPVIGGVLFVGLIWLWLVPRIHFYAMLDVRLYRLMNWSMLVDGLFFWFLVLDPRPSPPARLKPPVRVLLLAAAIPPQMAAGALITFAPSNLYPIYELCGRAFAGVSSIQDQNLGALILWIPGTGMCVVGGLVAMYFWLRRADEPDAKAEQDVSPAGEGERGPGRLITRPGPR